MLGLRRTLSDLALFLGLVWPLHHYLVALGVRKCNSRERLCRSGVTVIQTSAQKFPTQRHGDSLDSLLFLVNKTNRHTGFQYYWYYDYMFRAAFLPIIRSSYPLHRHWYILCSFDDRLLSGVGWNGHQICIKCTNADVLLRTPDDGQKGCPKHVES